MSDEYIVGLLTFVGSLIAVVRPIIKLNSSIVKLNTTLEMFEKQVQQKHGELEHRVTIHGEQIDELEKSSVNHETRITNLEKGR